MKLLSAYGRGCSWKQCMLTGARLVDPAVQVLGVGDGGGHGEQADRGRAADDDLLPHAAAARVAQVVDLRRASGAG